MWSFISYLLVLGLIVGLLWLGAKESKEEKKQNRKQIE